MERAKTCPEMVPAGKILMKQAKKTIGRPNKANVLSEPSDKPDSGLTADCFLCGKALTDDHYLRLHIRLVHECEKCGLRFVEHRERDAHVARVHGLTDIKPLVGET